MDFTTERIGRQLRRLTQEEFRQLMSPVNSGSGIGKFNLALCYLYGQNTEVDFDSSFELFTKASMQGDSLAGLFVGYFHEMGLRWNNNYALAIYFYRTFSPSVEKHIDKAAVEREARMQGASLTGRLAGIHSKAMSLAEEILNIRYYCIYYPKDDSFRFNWTEETRTALLHRQTEFNLLAEEYKACFGTINITQENASQYQPLIKDEAEIALFYDVSNALCGRDALFGYLAENGLTVLDREKDFEYALGCCLKSPRGRYDGVQMIASHDDDPLWEERAKALSGTGPVAGDILEGALLARDVDGDSVLGEVKQFQPLWERYENEQKRCREKASVWKRMMADECNESASRAYERQRQEEDRRRMEEDERRRQDELREQEPHTEEPPVFYKSDSSAGSKVGFLIDDMIRTVQLYYSKLKQKPKLWIWIIVGLFLLAGAYEYMKENQGQGTQSDMDYFMDNGNNGQTSTDMSAELEFVRAFYAANGDYYTYVSQNTTQGFQNRLGTLERQYGRENTIAYVFFAATPELLPYREQGPLFYQEGGRIRVDFVYGYYPDGMNKQSVRNSVYLTVTKSAGRYLLSDFEVTNNFNN